MVASLSALAAFGYHRQTIDPWTLDARLAVWKLQVNETLEHPLVGIGYGSATFMKRFGNYPETEKANGPHSAVLMIAMGSGIPGVALLAWVIAAAIRPLVFTAKHSVDQAKQLFALGIAVMIVGFVTRNFFDYMFAGSLAYLFWILLGTGLAIAGEERVRA
jgi:O-antigen ligase